MASADEQNFLASPVLTSEEDVLAQAVCKAQKGNHAAFASLYQRYKASIWQRLTYFVDEQEAVQDLFQETFLRAWQKLPELKSGVPFESWLKRIAANLAIETREKDGRKMKILLAGATGVIGQRLIPLLTASGHEVIGTTRQASKTAHLRNLGVTPRVANAFDRDGIAALLHETRPDVVIHQFTDLSDKDFPAK